jgi:hypothetical membrane protein
LSAGTINCAARLAIDGGRGDDDLPGREFQSTVEWVRKIRLKVAVFMPWLMVADVAVAQRFYPGFDPGSQFISELGAVTAPYPWVFNAGMVLAGIAGIIAGWGFTAELEAAGGRRQVSAFAGLWVALTGLGGAFAGLFHWPDEMHRACGIGLAIQLAPFFTAWALWGHPGHKRLVWFSLAWGAMLTLVLMLLTGVWNVRTGHDVGLWQRWHAFLGLVWLAVAAFCLERGIRNPALAATRTSAANA